MCSKKFGSSESCSEGRTQGNAPADEGRPGSVHRLPHSNESRLSRETKSSIKRTPRYSLDPDKDVNTPTERHADCASCHPGKVPASDTKPPLSKICKDLAGRIAAETGGSSSYLFTPQKSSSSLAANESRSSIANKDDGEVPEDRSIVTPHHELSEGKTKDAAIDDTVVGHSCSSGVETIDTASPDTLLAQMSPVNAESATVDMVANRVIEPKANVSGPETDNTQGLPSDHTMVNSASPSTISADMNSLSTDQLPSDIETVVAGSPETVLANVSADRCLSGTKSGHIVSTDTKTLILPNSAIRLLDVASPDTVDMLTLQKTQPESSRISTLAQASPAAGVIDQANGVQTALTKDMEQKDKHSKFTGSNPRISDERESQADELQQVGQVNQMEIAQTSKEDEFLVSKSGTQTLDAASACDQSTACEHVAPSPQENSENQMPSPDKESPTLPNHRAQDSRSCHADKAPVSSLSPTRPSEDLRQQSLQLGHDSNAKAKSANQASTALDKPTVTQTNVLEPDQCHLSASKNLLDGQGCLEEKQQPCLSAPACVRSVTDKLLEAITVVQPNTGDNIEEEETSAHRSNHIGVSLPLSSQKPAKGQEVISVLGHAPGSAFRLVEVSDYLYAFHTITSIESSQSFCMLHTYMESLS